MSDDQRLSFKGLLDIYTTALRLLGAANATGAIAAGAAFHAFEKTSAAQSSIKGVIVAFLIGVLAFAASYLAIFLTQMNMEHYFAGSREQAEWEKTFLVNQKPPQNYLAEANRCLVVAMFAGLLSLALFLAALGIVILFALSL
jgi:hypothetical protein